MLIEEELTAETIAKRQRDLNERRAKVNPAYGEHPVGDAPTDDPEPNLGEGLIGSTGLTDDGKPIIKIVAGKVASIVDQIESAVIAADLGLYQRGGNVVRIETGVIAMPDAPERPTLLIRTKNAESLREAMCTAAHFVKYDERRKKDERWVTIDPPVQRATDWISRHERMRLPILSGIISSPLILPVERRIISEPGYDAGTGLFFEPLGASFPAIPERPSRDDALAAVSFKKNPGRVPFRGWSRRC